MLRATREEREHEDVSLPVAKRPSHHLSRCALNAFCHHQRDLASRLRPTPNGKRQAAACRKMKKIVILAYFSVFSTCSIAVANRQYIS